MRIIRLEDNNDDIINKIYEWNYNWWGIKNNNSLEEVNKFKDNSSMERLYKLDIE